MGAERRRLFSAMVLISFTFSDLPFLKDEPTSSVHLAIKANQSGTMTSSIYRISTVTIGSLGISTIAQHGAPSH